MTRYTKRTIEDAIEVLLCTADTNGPRDRREPLSITTHDIALDSWLHTGNLYNGPIARLADAAWWAVARHDSCGGHHSICLESAQLLRDGWLPGNKVYSL